MLVTTRKKVPAVEPSSQLRSLFGCRDGLQGQPCRLCSCTGVASRRLGTPGVAVQHHCPHDSATVVARQRPPPFPRTMGSEHVGFVWPLSFPSHLLSLSVAAHPPRPALASRPLEPCKHCIKEKAARLRGLAFLAYSCSGGAKMTLARGGSKPAVVRGHLASKTAYVCKFSLKNRATRRVRGFFCRFWGFGAPKSAYVCRFSLRKARKCGYVCKKGLLEASGDPRRTYKLAPGTDPPSPLGLQIVAGE